MKAWMQGLPAWAAKAQEEEVVGSVATNARLGPKAAVAGPGSYSAFRTPSMASIYPTPCSAEHQTSLLPCGPEASCTATALGGEIAPASLGHTEDVGPGEHFWCSLPQKHLACRNC